MIFQNKKYFYVFSVLLIFSSPLFSEELSTNEDEQMQKIQKYVEQKWTELRKMVDVVDRDPQGLKYGLGIGLINASLHKIFQNRSIFKVLHVLIPCACVSYWVASRNEANKDLAYDFGRFIKKNEKSLIENQALKDNQDAYKKAMIEKDELLQRLKIDNERLQDFYNQTIYESKKKFQQKND